MVGACIVGGIIYRIQPRSTGEGIPSYIHSIQRKRGVFGFSETFFKFIAALITLAFYGNGGIVGPLGHATSGIMSFITHRSNRLFRLFDDDDTRTAAICGMAAALGAIFHSSIGSGIFAVEILQRKSMSYRDLFPAILSSATAVFFCKATGWKSFYLFATTDAFMDVRKIGWLLLFVTLTGATGWLYTTLFRLVSIHFQRHCTHFFFCVTLGSIVAFFLAWLVNPALLGTSNALIEALITHDITLIMGQLSALPLVPVVIIMLLIKMTANCITVGSGMSAGFAGPTIIVGMLLGVAASHIAGVAALSPTYYAFLAAGFAGMLSSAMNVPLAAAVMAIEIFGLQYSFPAGLAAILGFQVTRHITIYDYPAKPTS